MRIKHLKNSKLLWFGISTAIILCLVYFADPGRFIKSIRTADPLPMIPSLILGLAVLPTWGYVWHRVFTKSGIELGYMKTFRVFMAGQFMNWITPLGQFGGEPVMAYILKENSDASYEKSLSSVFSADILNATPPITFIIGGSTYLLIFHSLNDVIAKAFYTALIAAAGGGALIYFLWFDAGTIERKLLRLLEKIHEKSGRGERIVKAAQEKLEEVEENFRRIGSEPKYLIKTAFWSHAGFIMQILNFYFIYLALGYNADFTSIFFISVLSGLANFSPTPGGSGTYEAAVAGLTTVFTPLDFATGLTAGILFRLTTYWPGMLIGYVSLNSLQSTKINEEAIAEKK